MRPGEQGWVRWMDIFWASDCGWGLGGNQQYSLKQTISAWRYVTWVMLWVFFASA
jgi:hypothetical protein